MTSHETKVDSQFVDFDGQILDGLEFCSKAYALFESIRNQPNGPSRLRQRNRHDKKLIEEILPICKYLQASYRIGRYISIRWTNGSQSGDAEIFQHGGYVNHNYYPANAYLEVTYLVHPKEYLLRELLDTKGVAFGIEGISRLENGEIESISVGHSNRDFIEKDAQLIFKRILEKASIPYPDETTLIVACNLHTIYYRDEWNELIAKVQEALPKSSFREIYLYDTVGQYSFSFFPNYSPEITNQ